MPDGATSHHAAFTHMPDLIRKITNSDEIAKLAPAY